VILTIFQVHQSSSKIETFEMIFQLVSVVGLAAGTNYVASVRSKFSESYFLHENEVDPIGYTLEPKVAALSCLLASCSLLLMFYFFDQMSLILLVCTLFSSFMALIFVFTPVLQWLFEITKTSNFCLLSACGINLQTLTTILFAISILGSWLWTGHWFLNNLLGFSICILGVSLMKIKNMKVACLLFVCLFFYDIFWVFYSKNFFGENVMVSVAQKTATNPVVQVAKAMNLEAETMAPRLELPAKMIVPSFDGESVSLLGLGDIAIPGLLLSFLYRSSLPKSDWYFWLGMTGYVVGLILTMCASMIWNHAQPALLFLVPSTLIPVFALAFYLKETKLLWEINEGETLGRTVKSV